MQFTMPAAELFIPDGAPLDQALSRTTHMGVVAHQDDLEVLAYHGILECFGHPTNWFAGIVVTNGAGSPRAGLYAHYTDEQMQQVRRVEQKKAAMVGDYAAVALLDFPSSAVKDPANRGPVEDIRKLLLAARPDVVYTHNPADKHDTHVGTMLRAIQAIRELPEEARPKRLYGCETWRDLDWVVDEDKVTFDVAEHPNLGPALLGIFDSQIAGGKRYDLAIPGRRTAHATLLASHGVDETTQMIFGIDMTPLVTDPSLSVQDYIQGYIDRLTVDVSARLGKLSA